MIFQHIDTAPVWEAFKTDCECPLCLLQGRSEQSYVENFLGGSVMEPAVRVEVNQKGFCRHHLTMLYGAGNRLGLALMTDTYMKEVISRLRADTPPAPAGRFRFGAKSAAAGGMSGTCILCDRLQNTMARYEETLLYMWRTDPAFREVFVSGKGVCLVHYESLLRRAGEKLSGQNLNDFKRVLRQTALANMERVEEELNWFTLKFDYRNREAPWGNSRDAVERALIKLRGGVAAAEDDKQN